jgi:hypothetical protein
MIFDTFEISFDQLEIFPGVYAYGEADFILAGGKFVMTGLWTGTTPESSGMTVSGSDSPIWQMIEAALMKTPEDLNNAYQREQRRQIECIRESEASYAYTD